MTDIVTMIVEEIANPVKENLCPFTKKECPVYDTKGAVQECVQEVEYMGLLDCPEGVE